MSFDAGTIFISGVGYLLLLFAIAYAAERRLLPTRLVEHPAVYVLSLAVYASAFAIYGVFRFALEQGYSYLNYYVGLATALVVAPLLLRPLLRICRGYRLNSLADLLTFRYRSPWVGAAATVSLLLASMPLLALQIQAVSESILMLSNVENSMQAATQRREGLALLFCIVISVFTMLFGSRHLASRESHRGLVAAIAFESVIKLLALLAAGAVAVYGVFGGFGELHSWLEQQETVRAQLNTRLSGDVTRFTLVIFFAAAVCLPHMFHMLFAENPSMRNLQTASWGLPLYLLLIALPVLPILWAGIALQSWAPVEYFPLSIGLETGRAWLAELVFLGGLSAASSAIMVATLALASMCLNHLVLPVYQPPASVDIYRWLLWTRRALIAAIILAGYVFYRLVSGHNVLSALGVVGMTGCLQFLPGVLAVLYWPGANSRGFVAGLAVGLSLWFAGLLLPTVGGYQPSLLTELYLGSVAPELSWVAIAAIALSLNTATFILVSWATSTPVEERNAAEVCAIDDLNRPTRQLLSLHSAAEMQRELAPALGEAVARREVERALEELQLDGDERRPYALRRLRDRIEINLSALMGPVVARTVVDRHLPYIGDVQNRSEDITFIESRLELYQTHLTGLAADLDNLRRHHRQTLDNLPIGLCSLGRDHEVILWNRAMADLTGIDGQAIAGARLADLPAPWCELLGNFSDSSDLHWRRQAVSAADTSARWLNLHKAADDLRERNEQVIVVEDITETQLLEDKLTHQERLASIGRLAAGVAHEIGNPVTGIACLAQNLRYETDNPEILDSVEQIVKQTQRITSIVHSLVNFAHSGRDDATLVLEPVDVGHCVAEAVQLLSLDREATPVIFNNRCPSGLLALGNTQRLIQVFINLLSNARDASPEHGMIDIDAHRDGEFVHIGVCDDGGGIAPELLERIFEPFFTTKDPGKGTGLGLALVYSMIEDVGGEISIESPVAERGNAGACVHLRLRHYGTPE